MNSKQWTKKDKIACIIIFVIAIITFITFLSTITLSYMFDEHTAEDSLTAGYVKVTPYVGNTANGKIQFEGVYNPNTSYVATDSNKYRVRNEGVVPVYVMVKIDCNYYDYIRPLRSRSATKWEYGVGHSEYLFYNQILNVSGTTSYLAEYWVTSDFGNAVAGEQITINITAYAVQAVGGAIENLIANNVDGWQYAPAEFREMAGVSS